MSVIVVTSYPHFNSLLLLGSLMFFCLFVCFTNRFHFWRTFRIQYITRGRRPSWASTCACEFSCPLACQCTHTSLCSCKSLDLNKNSTFFVKLGKSIWHSFIYSSFKFIILCVFRRQFLPMCLLYDFSLNDLLAPSKLFLFFISSF